MSQFEKFAKLYTLVNFTNVQYNFFLNFCKTHVFYFLNKTHKRKTNKHILAPITHTKCIILYNIGWIMDLDTKILNGIPYTSSDQIFNLTLKFELDLTILFKYWKFLLNFSMIKFIL